MKKSTIYTISSIALIIIALAALFHSEEKIRTSEKVLAVLDDEGKTTTREYTRVENSKLLIKEYTTIATHNAENNQFTGIETKVDTRGNLSFFVFASAMLLSVFLGYIAKKRREDEQLGLA